MSKHTPGPWQFIREYGENKIIAPPTDHLRTHETLMCDTQYYPWCPDNDADWRLIAAAPELLAALRVMLAYQMNDITAECDQARAAIAKATGEQA